MAVIELNLPNVQKSISQMGDHFQVEHRFANMLSQMGNNKLSMRPYWLLLQMVLISCLMFVCL